MDSRDRGRTLGYRKTILGSEINEESNGYPCPSDSRGRRCAMSNKDIIKYFYEVVVSENLLDELHKYISEDCVQRVGEKVYFVGTAGMKQHLLAVKQTYPDYTMKIIRQYTDGDYVISEFIMRGTHKGDFLGITPTNKVLEITGVDIDRVVDGKIVEHGGSTETFETFWTNGLIKPV